MFLSIYPQVSTKSSDKFATSKKKKKKSMNQITPLLALFEILNLIYPFSPFNIDDERRSLDNAKKE